MNAHDLLSHLRKVKKTGPSNWIACCPAHEDKQPSMTIRETETGKILFHCFAGCSVSDIAGSLGINLSDLFPPKPDSHSSKPITSRWMRGDALQCVAQEAMIVAIVAQAIFDRKPVSASDLARVHLANRRLNDAVEAARG